MAVKYKKILDLFLSELDLVQIENEEVMDQANKSIILARHVLRQLRTKITKVSFKNSDQEIDFFKRTKQIALVPLIYFTEVRSFEIQFPKASNNAQQLYIESKLSKLDRFFVNNIDFSEYIRNDKTHFDQQYFTRQYLDSYHIMSSNFYYQDPDFCTARDMLLGKLKAYKKLIPYLHNRFNNFNKVSFQNKQSKLKWTASKTALTELIYALHFNQVINNGNVEIKDIASTFQNVLHFELGDFYKIFSEIKSRKISRTKFLDDLSSGLQSQMEKFEE